MKILSLIKYLFSLLFIVILLTFSIFYLYIFTPANDHPSDNYIKFSIPRGTSFSGIMDTLENRQLIKSRRHFYLTAKYLDRITSLQAGHFNICGGLNYFDLLNELQHAKKQHKTVTIPEGMEMVEIADLMAKALGIDENEFISYMDSVQLFLPDSFRLENLEGSLYPDTYFFYDDMSAREVIRRLTGHFCSIMAAENIPHLADSLKLSMNKVLSMASIIQGEVIFDSEMATVSAVYWNRIRKWMPLQADPTIQYIIPGPDIRLRHRHLEVDSPYNTYKHYGLPPGPINNPGIKAIKAALFPSDETYLYFVAVGDGYHKFSNTLKEHNRAKKEFQKFRRQVYYEKLREQRN